MKNHFAIIACLLVCACSNSQRNARPLPHYDLEHPQVFSLPQELREISGIVLLPGSADSVLAEQDEEGKVYYFRLGDQKIPHVKFGAKGDYEDIALHRNRVYLLRSEGSIFSFPLAQLGTGAVTDLRSWDQLLPPGEYEGMFADPKSRKLYVLCKHCAGEKTGRSAGGSIFDLKEDGNIVPSGSFQLDVKEIGRIIGEKKINFHPSALALNSVTGEWFILSSVNSMIVVADASWKVKDVFPLSKTLFKQPEGIAFDSLQNLYISNEGGAGAGNILKFAYKK